MNWSTSYVAYGAVMNIVVFSLLWAMLRPGPGDRSSVYAIAGWPLLFNVAVAVFKSGFTDGQRILAVVLSLVLATAVYLVATRRLNQRASNG